MTAEEMKGAVSSVLSGLTALDMLSEDQRASLQKAVGAMEIFCGASQMIAMATAMTEVKTAVATALASAETAAFSISGIGLGRVALAGAITAGVGVGMYAILDTVIDGNLNDPVDRARVESQVGAIL